MTYGSGLVNSHWLFIFILQVGNNTDFAYVARRIKLPSEI